MKACAGVDLHSSNNYLGIIDDHDKRLYGKRMPNELNRVLMALEPFRERLYEVRKHNMIFRSRSVRPRLSGSPCRRR